MWTRGASEAVDWSLRTGKIIVSQSKEGVCLCVLSYPTEHELIMHETRLHE